MELCDVRFDAIHVLRRRRRYAGCGFCFCIDARESVPKRLEVVAAVLKLLLGGVSVRPATGSQAASSASKKALHSGDRHGRSEIPGSRLRHGRQHTRSEFARHGDSPVCRCSHSPVGNPAWHPSSRWICLQRRIRPPSSGGEFGFVVHLGFLDRSKVALKARRSKGQNSLD